MNKQLQEIKNILKEEVGTMALYFSEPVKVKVNGTAAALFIWGVNLTSKGDVEVMDVENQWQSIEKLPADLLVVHYLHQRLKTIPTLKNIVEVCKP